MVQVAGYGKQSESNLLCTNIQENVKAKQCENSRKYTALTHS